MYDLRQSWVSQDGLPTCTLDQALDLIEQAYSQGYGDGFARYNPVGDRLKINIKDGELIGLKVV